MYGLRVMVGLELALGFLGYGWFSGVQDQCAYGSELDQ